MKLQCGYEDECKAKSCLNCPRHMKFKTLDLTLAEATCVEDFHSVDLDQWGLDHQNTRTLAQDVMRKLYNRIKWE